MNSARKDLFDKIISVYPALSPKRKRVAELVMKDYKKIFLMTGKEIARECQVSEPTIIRFTVDLGFSGYAEFLHYMKALLHAELTSVERLTKASRQHDERTTIQRYCQNAMRNLENLINSVSEKEFKKIATTIYKAETVYVVGYRASATLAYHFGYLLKKIRENVIIDTNLSWELMDSLSSLTGNAKSSLMVVIAFPRYPRRTIAVMEYAKKCNIKVLGISDNPRSPIVTLADQYIIIDIESVSFVDPFAHIIAFLGALVHEVTFLDNAKAMECLTKFDEGAKATNEFFTEESADQRLEYKLNGSYVTSLWPQKEREIT
jgi:DNA-binding MurR/RpiR family transcriptional regulator